MPEEDSVLAPARRHVEEGGRRVFDQIARVEALRSGGHHTAMAEALLAQFRATLDAMRVQLAIAQKEKDIDSYFDDTRSTGEDQKTMHTHRSNAQAAL
jgi:hypothetical protein